MIGPFINWFLVSIKIWRQAKVPRRGALIRTYLRICSTQALGKVFGAKKTSTHIFGKKISFFDYDFFVYLFEEIFMQQLYFFESDKKNPFIIDCGSNIGMSVFYFKWLYPDCRIIAFEPDPTTFAMLEKNIQAAGFQNVELRNEAVLDYEGKVDFYKNEGHEGSLIMGVYQSRGADTAHSMPCVSLSRFLQASVDFLKMDIEGAELKVFRDLESQQDLGKIKQMVIECHHNIGPEPLLAEILGLLNRNKFDFQVSSFLKSPYPRGISQDVMIYAYPRG